jgi:para-aminobenzoate synthetase
MKESLRSACDRIVSTIQAMQKNRSAPLVVALDGESGSGKSTLAPLLAEALNAALIQTDDFFSGHIPYQDWDEFSIQERYEKVLDWARIREQVLQPLRSGRSARWHAFDFVSGLREDGTYSMESFAKESHPADVILLEGAYSASPKLSDLIDFSILINVPLEVRHARLREREDQEFQQDWHVRWDEVEAFYRRDVKPKSSYDLVVKLA